MNHGAPAVLASVHSELYSDPGGSLLSARLELPPEPAELKRSSPSDQTAEAFLTFTRGF